MTNKEKKIMDKPFKLTSVARADILEQELMTEEECLALTDAEMVEIADMVKDGIMEGFWDSLGYAVDYIKELKTKGHTIK